MSKKVQLGSKMYDQLSRGDNNIVVALDENKVAKLFDLGNENAQKELANLQAANAINDLVVRVEGVEPSEGYEYDLLVMERLQPMEYRAFSMAQRREMVMEFLKKLQELHEAGWAHGDIQRPVLIQYGGKWDNILVTKDGIRLIDTGFAMTSDKAGFKSTVEEDKADVKEWIKVFLTL